MKSRDFAVTMLLLALGTVLTETLSATACAPATPPNKAVEIADESAIIVWDAATKTQHFIRRASFQTDAADFGFLVPTPTRPVLEGVDNEAFTDLARITAPRVIQQKRPSGGFSCGCSKVDDARSPMGEALPPTVRILEEKQVAGYQAAVLEADDADALNRWLQEHEYEFTPSLQEWAKPYVAAGWKITAFKVAKSAPDAEGVRTQAVRMSFKTDRPFFPYREPAPAVMNNPQSRRLLRVFFLAGGACKVKWEAQSVHGRVRSPGLARSTQPTRRNSCVSCRSPPGRDTSLGG